MLVRRCWRRCCRLRREAWGSLKASAMVRLVSAGWKAVHDALVTRLVLRRQTTDEAVGILVRRFPAVASLEYSTRRATSRTEPY
jgi:hypothetical protein